MQILVSGVVGVLAGAVATYIGYAKISAVVQKVIGLGQSVTKAL